MTVTVLLGAGASADANIPVSARMTDALLSQIKPRSQALLHFVYGGLLMQEAARVHSRPYPPGWPIFVDAEDLFNAVEALGNRATLEAAPFVSSWHPLIEQFDKDTEGDLVRRIKDGLDQQLASFGSDRLARTLTSAILSVGKGELFRQVTTDMVEALKQLLAISDTDRIDYLSPLVELHRSQSGGLVIATLNYDILIEQVGAVHSIGVDDCLDRWLATGSAARRSTDLLTLLKLHGSINWVQDVDGSVRRTAEGDRGRPALIFGGINKLRADGPYLDMLIEWRTHLDKCDHLIIIGYSFRDGHVNAIIERWHRQDRLKRITVVDLAFNQGANELTQYLHDLSNETLALFERTGSQIRQGTQWLKAPVQLIRKGAKEVLPSLFDEISQWPPTSADRPNIRSALPRSSGGTT